MADLWPVFSRFERLVAGYINRVHRPVIGRFEQLSADVHRLAIGLFEQLMSDFNG